MQVIVLLHHSYTKNDEITLNNLGYTIEHVAKLRPNMIVVSKNNANLAELENLSIVESARFSRLGHIPMITGE